MIYTGGACGRVNLIGEHTDYNGGFVLPTAIPQYTRVRLWKRSDQAVHAYTKNMRDDAKRYILGEEQNTGTWIDYVQGVTAILAKGNFPISGFNVEIQSEVPIGSGLSSSAALEISLLRAIQAAFGFTFDPMTAAKICQRVENEFVGAHVGIMDPVATSLATYGSAIFLDTRSLRYEVVNLPVDEMDLIVINSGVAHRNTGGDYNTRRAECEKACELLGISLLRELDVADLPRLDILPDVLKRRARHVITENARVHKAVEAIHNKDLEALGNLFAESHASMRDDYEVSIPEIDMLVEITSAEPDVYGARLTGGGFGGSIVAISKKGTSEEIVGRVLAKYKQTMGFEAKVLVP